MARGVFRVSALRSPRSHAAGGPPVTPTPRPRSGRGPPLERGYGASAPRGIGPRPLHGGGTPPPHGGRRGKGARPMGADGPMGPGSQAPCGGPVAPPRPRQWREEEGSAEIPQFPDPRPTIPLSLLRSWKRFLIYGRKLLIYYLTHILICTTPCHTSQYPLNIHPPLHQHSIMLEHPATTTLDTHRQMCKEELALRIGQKPPSPGQASQ